jgi:hypothetical protein
MLNYMALFVFQYLHISLLKIVCLVVKLLKNHASTRTHKCPHCGYIADRDHNAAKNILALGLEMLGAIVNSTDFSGTVGHSETGVKSPNATGESDLWISDSNIAICKLSH